MADGFRIADYDTVLSRWARPCWRKERWLMAATKADIAGWFDVGVREQATHMLVVCDTFDHEDYPVYAMDDEGCRHAYDDYSKKERVMEIYDLRLPREPQLDARRAWHLPAAKETM